MFLEAGEEDADVVEVRTLLGIFHPAVFHQRDQVLVHLGVAVDERPVMRPTVTTDLLKDLYASTNAASFGQFIPVLLDFVVLSTLISK